MDHVGPEKKPDDEVRDEKQVFCPKCAAQARLFIDVLDSRYDRKYRLFACRCGEVIWVGG